MSTLLSSRCSNATHSVLWTTTHAPSTTTCATRLTTTPTPPPSPVSLLLGMASATHSPPDSGPLHSLTMSFSLDLLSLSSALFLSLLPLSLSRLFVSFSLDLISLVSLLSLSLSRMRSEGYCSCPVCVCVSPRL